MKPMLVLTFFILIFEVSFCMFYIFIFFLFQFVNKQRESTSQGVRHTFLNTSNSSDLKEAQTVELILSKDPKQFEKPPISAFAKTTNDIIPKESLGTQTSQTHSESEKSDMLNSPQISQPLPDMNKQKVSNVANSEASLKDGMHPAKDKHLSYGNEKGHSVLNELPTTSFYKENINLESYLSTISTPSQLSELSNAQKIISDKILIPTGELF